MDSTQATNMGGLYRMVKKIIPFIIFLTISSVYFYPALKGYKLKQPDVEKYWGMSKEIFDYREKYGKEPLWANSMFGGMPAYQISTINPNILKRLENLILKVIPAPIYLMFLLMTGMYFLLLCFNVKWELATIGGMAFGLASFNVIYLGAGHIAKIHTLAYLPFVLGGIIYAYRKDFLKGAVILMIACSLFIAAGHFQIMYYGLYMIAAFIIEEFIRLIKKPGYFLRTSGLLLIAACLAVMSNTSMLYTTFEYSKHTTRGKSELHEVK